jgi:predicted dehydrogenase
MKKLILTVFALGMMAPICPAQEYKIAIVGLVHSHVWGHLSTILKSKDVKLVGVAEPNPALVAEAQKAGVDKSLISDNYVQMLDKTKPDIVWAFVENNRHLEIVKACAPRKINVIFEKPLASNGPDAREIRKLATQAGIKVMTNYQMAWWPANYTAKKAADSEIGQIYRLHGIVGHGGPGSTGARNAAFFAWLTDPVKNGAGALMDFGCYNALWSLWYLGKPETVYAHVNHLRPETFPKVEDNADLMLGYKHGVGLFEGSWDLPRGYQDLEVFGLKGSVYMEQKGVTVQLSKDREGHKVDLTPLPPNESEPIAFMVDHIRRNKPIEGMTAIDINVSVIEIIDAAKQSIATGRAVQFSH